VGRRPRGAVGAQRDRATLQRGAGGLGGGVAGDPGRRPLRGQPPVGACLGQPLPSRRAGRARRSVPPAQPLPAPARRGGRGQGVRAAPAAPRVGAAAAAPRAGTASGRAVAEPDGHLPGAGAQPAHHAGRPAPAAGVAALRAGAAGAAVSAGLGRATPCRRHPGQGADRGRRPLTLLRQRPGDGARHRPGGLWRVRRSACPLRRPRGGADRQRPSSSPAGSASPARPRCWSSGSCGRTASPTG
jgi:hypothetical protein